jgi:hypothetical protein
MSALHAGSCWKWCYASWSLANIVTESSLLLQQMPHKLRMQMFAWWFAQNPWWRWSCVLDNAFLVSSFWCLCCSSLLHVVPCNFKLLTSSFSYIGLLVHQLCELLLEWSLLLVIASCVLLVFVSISIHLWDAMLTSVHSCITNFHSYSHMIVTLKRFCQVKLLFQMHATSTLNILRSKQIVYKVPNVAESLQLHGNYVRQLLLIRPSGQGHLPFSWGPPNGHDLKHTHFDKLIVC